MIGCSQEFVFRADLRFVLRYYLPFFRVIVYYFTCALAR